MPSSGLLPREWHRGPHWASPAARAEWEPVIAMAAAMWSELEVVSVGSVRPSALLSLTYEELVRATRDCSAQGLEVTPLAEGRGAVHVRGLRDAWLAAWGDDERVGQLLGFPACCRRHFSATWGQGRTETFLDTAGAGAWELNLGLRWLGVRTVPHLPCSRECSASLDLARRALALAPEVERDAMRRLLELPLTYSVESGVGIVDAGVFRLMVGTDVPAIEPESWEDNGFASREAMDAAHAVLAAVVGQVGSALDLGAGDGALLARIADGRAGSWVGVERDAARVVGGYDRHPGVALVHDTIERFVWGGEPFDVALLMPGRLLEMAPEEAAVVRARLFTSARRVVAYAYGDWISREEDGLVSLCAKAGLKMPGELVVGCGNAQAAEVAL